VALTWCLRARRRRRDAQNLGAVTFLLEMEKGGNKQDKEQYEDADKDQDSC
jgi:hypothetical protein